MRKRKEKTLPRKQRRKENWRGLVLDGLKPWDSPTNIQITAKEKVCRSDPMFGKENPLGFKRPNTTTNLSGRKKYTSLTIGLAHRIISLERKGNPMKSCEPKLMEKRFLPGPGTSLSFSFSPTPMAAQINW
jgi:hypothetical protein|tara:strand:- start:481 stop:873 length:393 start_codon:yes stop_codon:yes gene_type:complete